MADISALRSRGELHFVRQQSNGCDTSTGLSGRPSQTTADYMHHIHVRECTSWE